MLFINGLLLVSMLRQVLGISGSALIAVLISLLGWLMILTFATC